MYVKTTHWSSIKSVFLVTSNDVRCYNQVTCQGPPLFITFTTQFRWTITFFLIKVSEVICLSFMSVQSHVIFGRFYVCVEYTKNIMLTKSALNCVSYNCKWLYM